MKNFEQIQVLCYKLMNDDQTHYYETDELIIQSQSDILKYKIIDKSTNEALFSCTFGFDDENYESVFISNISRDFDLNTNKYHFLNTDISEKDYTEFYEMNFRLHII